MKIVILHGQSHHGISYHIGRYIADSLEDSNPITEFFLPNDFPHFCRGCLSCMYQNLSACPHAQSLEPITQAIHEAQLLLFTTPVYCCRTSGSMKALLDHYFTWWHSHTPQEDMYHKQAIVVGVGASVGMKKAISDIRVNLRNWGISHIQSFPVQGLSISWEDMDATHKASILKQADRRIKKALQTSPSTTIPSKLRFYMFRYFQKKNWIACVQDHVYWKEKGWLDKQRPWNITHE